jgi:hypothetical protein
VIKLLLSKEKDVGLFLLLSHISEKTFLADSSDSFLYMDLYNDRMVEYTECFCDILSHLQGSFKKWVTTLLFL